MSGIYTDEEVDAVAAVLVKGLGDNALTSAIGPSKERFRGAMKAAVDGQNNARIAELEVFRKDVGAYVRLYDFLSQIIDFGDTDVEKHAVFFRVLATRSARLVPLRTSTCPMSVSSTSSRSRRATALSTWFTRRLWRRRRRSGA